MVSDRTVLVRLKANVSDFQRGMMSAKASIRSVTDEIDTTNDRTAWLAQSILGIGPALVPLTGAAVPALSAMATQMTVAALAAGVAALAFNGVGDGLKALNEYQLDPSAENFEKLALAMEKIGPAGEAMVRFLDEVGPQFAQLGMTAREGMFPGVQDGISAFLTQLPQVNRIVREVAEGMGDLAAASGEALAGYQFAAFFDYLESDAKPILMEMGKTLGGFAEGLANMLVSFGPLSMGFSRGFADMAQSFAEWSRGLDDNTSFQGFLSYIEEVGPMALNFLGQLIDTFASIVRAAAPVGELLIPIFTQFLNIIGAVADSPLGPVFVLAAAAMSLYGRAAALAAITTGGLLKTVGGLTVTNARAALTTRGLGAAMSVLAVNAMTAGAASQRMAAGSAAAAARLRTQGAALAGAGAQAALLGVVMTGAADKVGLTNTAMGILIGSMAGPLGAAVGGAVGGFLDIQRSGERVESILDGINKALENGQWDVAADGARQFKKELDDLNNASGFLDFIGDQIRTTAGVLKGDLQQDLGFFKPGKVKISDNRAAEQAASRARTEQNNAYTGRELQGQATARAATLAAGGYKLTAAAARELTMSQKELAAAANAANNALSRAGAIDQYASSLLDAKDALQANGKTLDQNTRAGLANRAALRGIAESATAAGDKMQNFGRKTKFMDKARNDFIRVAQGMGMTRAEAVRLARQFGLVDRIRAKPRVTEQGSKQSQARVKAMRDEINRIRGRIAQMGERGAAAARARIAALQAAINALRDKEVTITTRRVETVTVQRAAGNFVAGQAIRADGGPVYANTALGQTRGARDDTIPARLSHREWVQPVAAVDYYGEAFMEAVRTRRLRRPEGYADGGSPSRRNISVSAPPVSVGGASVRVIIDGREVRAIVDERIADHDDMRGMRGRTGG